MKYTVRNVKVGLDTMQIELTDGHVAISVSLPLLPEPYTDEGLMEAMTTQLRLLALAQYKAAAATKLRGKDIDIL